MRRMPHIPAIWMMTLLVSSSARADVDDVVAATLSRHPTLEAARAQVQAAEAAQRVAGAWMDPQLSVEYSNAPIDSFDIGTHPMGGLQIRLQQTFPTSGITARRAQAGRVEQRVRASALDEARVLLTAQVHQAWWRLARARALRTVWVQHRDAAGALLDAVRGRYEVGMATQADLLRLQVRRSQLDDALGDLDRDIAGHVAALQALAGPDTPLDTPDTLTPVPPEGTVPQWVDEATASRPALQQLRAQAEVARARADVAQAAGLPDLTVWAGYRVRTGTTATDPGTDFVSLGVSSPLPVSGARRGAGEATAARAQAHALEADAQALLDRLTSDITATEAGWHRAHDKALRFAADLLPAARRAFDSTLSAYQVGEADVASLYQAEVQLLDLERARLDAAVDTHLHAATMAALVGRLPGGSP